MQPLRKPSSACSAVPVGVLLAAFSAAGCPAETIAWDGGGGDGLWSNSLNWSGDVLPGPRDDVLIAAIPGLTVLHASDVTEIASLQTGSPLTIGGGSLHVAGTAVASAGAAVTLDGGSLVGGAWNVEAGLLRATSATANTLVGVAVVGDLDLDAILATVRIQDGLAVEGTVALTGPGARLVFEGDQTVSAGTFLLQGVLGLPARLAIDGDTTVVLGPQTVVHAINANLGGSLFISGTDTLVSQGTLVVDADGSPDDAVVRWLGDGFENAGVLDVIAGEARLTPSFWTSSGAIAVAETGKVRLGGTFTTADFDTIANDGPPIELVGVLDNRSALLMLDETIGTLQLLGGTIDGGEILLAGGNLAFSPISGNLLIDPVITGSIALVAPAERFRVAGDLWLDGTLSFLGAGCSITFDDPIASILAGTYVFTVAPSTSSTQSINIANGGTLTVEKGVVLSGGKGRIKGNPDSTLVLRGDVYHDVPGSAFQVTVGTLAIEGPIVSSAPDGTLSVTVGAMTVTGSVTADGGTISLDSGSPWINRGSISAVNGGTIVLRGLATSTGIASIEPGGGTVELKCTIDNTSQVLVLDYGRGEWLLAGAHVQGGTVIPVGGPLQVVFDQQATQLEDVVVEGAINVSGAYAELRIKGATTVSDTISLGPGAVLRGVASEGGTVAVLSGLAIEMNGSEAQPAVIGSNPAGTTLVLGSDVVVQGGHGVVGSAAGLINEGTILHDQGETTLQVAGTDFTNVGSVTAAAGKTIVKPEGTWTNDGTISVLGGAILRLEGTYLAAAYDSIDVEDGLVELGGTLDNTGTTLVLGADWPTRLHGGRLKGGTFAVSPDAAFSVSNSSSNRLSGAPAIVGELRLDEPSSRLRVIGGVAVDGTIRLTGSQARLTFEGEGAMLASGEVVLDAPPQAFAQVVIADPTTIAPGASMRGVGIIGGSPPTLTSTLINQGTIVSDQPGQLLTCNAPDLDNHGIVHAAGGSLIVSDPKNLEIGPTALVGGTWRASGGAALGIGAFGQTIEVLDATVELDGAGSTILDVGAVRQLLPGARLAIGGGATLTLSPVDGTLVNEGELSVEGGSLLTIAGGFAALASSRLAIQASAADATFVQATGTAALDGALEVGLAPGYFPAPGDTVEVVAAGAVSGTFAAVESCVGVKVTYLPDSATLAFDGVVPGDLDGDGSVGGADLGLLLAAWGPCGEGCCLADLDGDGAVGGADLGLLLGNWG